MKRIITIVSLTLLLINGNLLNAATYYSKSGQTVPTTLTNWTLNSDGTGANPANFTTANDIFVVQSGHSYTSSAAWTLGSSVNLRIDGTLNSSAQNLTVGGTTIINGTFNDDNNGGTNIFTGLLTVNASGSLVTANSSPFTFSGGITNAGTFNKSGTGNITFNASQTLTASANFTTFAGNVTVSSGTLTLAGTSNITFAGTFTVNASQSLIITNTGITTFTGLFTNNGSTNTATVTSAAKLIFNGGITNTGTSFDVPYLTFNTTSNRTITTSSAINWSSNNISITGNGTLTIAGTGVITIAGSAAVSFPAALVVSGNLTLSTSGTVTVVGTTTVTGNLTDNENTSTTTLTGLFTLTSGTVDLSAISTSNLLINGGLTYTAGTFNVPNATVNTTGNRTITATSSINWSSNNIAITGNGTLTVAGAGTVNIAGSASVAIPAALVVSGNLVFSTSGTVSVASTTTVTGSLVDNENTSSTTFSGTLTLSTGTLDLSAVSTNNLFINGGLTYTAGTFNVPNATFNTTGNRTVTATLPITWSTNNLIVTGSGTLIIAGSGGVTFTGSADLLIAGSLTVNSGSVLNFNTTGNTTVTTLLTVTGIVNLNASTFTSLGNININNGGTLDLGAGAYLKLANTRVITNAGIFRVVGTSGNPATVSNNGSGNYTVSQTAATGVFHANNFVFDNLGTTGIVISNGTIDATNNFSNGTFTNGLGGTNSTYLNLSSLNLGVGTTISNTSFGAGQVFNVTRTTGSGVLTFQDAQGALAYGTAGQQFEKDNGIPGTLINWNTSGSVYYSQGNAGFSSLSNWNTAPNGSGSAPIAAKLTDASSTFVIQTGHTVTVDQNIQVAALQVSASANLIVGNDGTARTVIVEGDFVVPVNANVLTGTVAATHTFTVKGNFTVNGLLNFAPTSTRLVNLTLEGTAKTITASASTTLNTITLNTGAYSSVSYTLASALTLNGSVIINANAILNDGGNLISVGANWYQTAVGAFVASGRVQFNGSGVQSIGGAAPYNVGITFNKVSFNGTANTVIINTASTVNDSLFATNGVSIVVSNITFTVNGSFEMDGGSTYSSAATTVFGGASAQALELTNASFTNITFSGLGVKTLFGASNTITGLVNITSNATLNGAPILNIAGSIRVDGTCNLAGTINLTGSSNPTIYTGSGTNALSLGTANINCNGSIWLGFVAPATSAALTVGGNITITNPSNLNNQYLVLNPNTTLTGNGANTISVGANANLYVRGTNNFPSNFSAYNFDVNSTVLYDYNAAQTIRGGITYGNIYVRASSPSLNTNAITKTVDGSLDINGFLYLGANSGVAPLTYDNITLNLGSFNHTLAGRLYNIGTASTAATGGTFTLDANDANQQIDQTSGNYNFYNFAIDQGVPNASRTKTFLSSINVAGYFSATNSGGDATNTLVVNMGGNSLNGSGASSNFTLGANVIFQTSAVTVANSMNTFGGVKQLDVNSTFNYNLSGNQDIATGFSYGNLLLSGSGNKTVADNLDINGYFNANGTAIFVDGGNTFTHHVAGHLYIPSANYTSPQSTITLDGTDQDVMVSGGTSNVYNLVVAGSGTKTLNGTLNVVNNFNVNPGAIFDANTRAINLGGNLNFGSGIFKQTTGTTTFNGNSSSIQTITSNTNSYLGALVINRQGANKTVQLLSDLTVNNNITLEYDRLTPPVVGYADFNTSNYNLTVGGSFIYYPLTTLNATGSTYFFNGANVQTVHFQGTGAFNNLDFSNAGVKRFYTNGYNGNTVVMNGSFTNNGSTVDNTTFSVDMTVAGDWNNTGIYQGNGRTVTFNGAIQNIGATSFGHVIIAGTNKKTLTGAISLAGNLTISSNDTLDVSNDNYAISIGGNWDMSAPGATFVPRTGTVVFAGNSSTLYTGSLVAGSTSTPLPGNVPDGKSFYNVTVNKTSGQSLALGTINSTFGDLKVANDFTIATGTFTTSAYDLFVGGNFVNNEIFNQNSANAAITLNAIGGNLIFDPGINASSVFRDIYINAGSANYTLQNNLNINNNNSGITGLIASGGTLNLNGKQIKFLTSYTGTVLSLTNNATLNADAGSYLAFANGNILTNAGGNLKLIGTSVNPATVTRSGSGGYTVVQTSGTLAANYYAFQFLNNSTADNGVSISGGTIDAVNNLSNGTFINGFTNSKQYLNLDGYAGDSIIAQNVVFNTGPTNNVKFTTSGNPNSKVIFTSASGTLVGAAYENDVPNGNATTGKVKWRNTGIYWVGGYGNKWNNGLNWSMGQVPTSIDTVYLDHRAFAGAYTVQLDSGANANCFRLIIDKGASANAIGLTLGATNTLTVAENVNVLSGCNITTTTASNQINVGGNWTFAATATFTATAGSVAFNPVTGIKYVTAPTTSPTASAFNNFIVNASTGATVMLSSPIFINNNVDLLGGMFDVSAGNLAIDVKGNWNIGSNGGFNPQAGTVTFSKSGSGLQTINAGPFYNFVSSAAAPTNVKQFTGNVSILNTVTIGVNTQLDAGTNTLYVGGSWTNNVGATALLQSGAGAINFNGSTGTQNIDNGAAPTTFNHVILQGAAGKTWANNSLINEDFNVSSSSGTVNLQTFTLSGNGTANNFIVSGATTIQVRGANNFPAGFETISLAANSTVNYISDVAQTIAVIPSPGYGNLTVQKITASGTTTKTAAGSLILQGGLTVADIYSVLNMSTNNADLTLTGNISLPAGGQQIVWGTGSSTLTHLGTAGWEIDADITGFNNITLSGSSWKRLNNHLTISGNVLVNSGVTLLMNNSGGTPFQITGNGSGKIFTMNSGASLQTAIASPTVAFPTGFSSYTLDPASTVSLNAGNGINQLMKSDIIYGNLTISNNAKTVSIQSGNPLRVQGTFTGASTTSPNAVAILDDNGQDIIVAGDVWFGTYTPSSSSRKLTLNGGNQIVRHYYASTLNLANIDFGGTGTKTFGDNGDAVTVTGNINIGTGVTVTSVNNVNFSGTSWINNGSWSHTSNTVTFNVAAPITINAGSTNTFANVAFTGTNTISFITNGATFTGGTFNLNGTGLNVDMGTLTHNIAGNITITSGTWTTTNASFNFNGGSQAIPAMTAKDISLTNSGTKTMTGNWSINNLTINNGVGLNTNSTSNYNINVAGNWNNAGTFTPNTGTVTFNGATSPITVNNNTSRFYIADFNPTSPVSYNLTATTTFINLTSSIGANANVSLQGNTLILGSATYTPKIFSVAGTLDVTSNGALKFDNTYTACIMNVTGTFKLVGSSALIASVSQYNTSGSYQNGHQININAGGTIHARYYLVKDMADMGMYVDAAATLDATNNFSDGTWSNIRTGTTATRRYLELNCASPGTSIANVTFNYSGSPTPITTGAYNVKRSNSATGTITFVTALGGNLGDFKFEDDGATSPATSASTGKIIWPVATNVTWTGAISSEWNLAGNWNPNIIPDSTINATIVLASNNPVIGTADAFCKNLIISNGQLSLQNAFTLNTKGDISIGTGTSVGVLTVMNASSTINCQGNWTRGANGVFSHGNGTVVFTGATGASTITPLSSPFYSVVFNNHTSVFYIVGNTVNFAGDFTIVDGQVFPNNSNYNFNITGNVNCEVSNGASFSTATVGSITLNGANQAITDPTFYNLNISGTGVKSTTGVITILGTTTINSGATFAANPMVSNIDFQGNVTINAGGTFVDGGGEHSFKGATWTGAGNYSGTGTVSFVRQGAQNQTINNATFHNLNINTGGGTVTIAGAVSLTGDLIVGTNNGGVNVNLGATITSSTGTGTFTLNPGKSFTCYGLNSFPTNFANYDLQVTSSVLYYGTANQNVYGTNYANLYLNNANTKTLLGDINVKGTLQLNNATLDVSANNYGINIQGSWFNTGTGTFVPRSGTVTFDATTTNQNINIGASATNPFYNLSTNNPGYTVNATLNTTIQNDLTVLSGTFSANGNIVYVGKNFKAIGGVFANSGTYYLNYTGNAVINIQTNNSILSNLTIDGIGSSFICNDNLSVAGNFKLLNGTFNGFNKVVNLGSGGNAIIINGTYQIGAGGVMAIGNLCTVSINGTLVAVGTPGNVATITRNTLGGVSSRYSGFQVNAGGTIQAQYYLIEYMGSGGILINAGATIDVTNNFSNGTFTNGVAGGIYLDIENNQRLTGTKRIVNVSFAINPGGSAKNVAKTSLPGDTVEFYNASGVFAGSSFENDPNGLIRWSGPVTLTWNGSVNTDWYTANNWTANFGPSIVPTGVENVIIANTTNQPVINMPGATTANLTINASANLTVTTVESTLQDLIVKGDVTINGTLRMSSANDGITVAGHWQKAAAGTVAITPGTVTFNPTIVKNINNGTGSFGNVVVSSSATVALGANTVITKDLSIASGTLDVSTSNYQLTVGGSILNVGTFLARNGKVILNASTGNKFINLGTSALFNVDFNPGAGVLYQLISSNLTIQGNVNVQAGTIDFNGLTLNMGDGVGSDFMAVNGGTLLIGGGAALKMGNGANIAVNAGAVIKLVGTSFSSLALLSGLSGTYGITINNGATIHAKYYRVENVNINGVYLKSGAIIDATNNFSKGFFANGTNGGAFLQLENNFANYTADSVEFNSGATFNCLRTTGTGIITFSDPSGAIGNFSFEKDELAFNASAGLIQWVYTTTTATWTGTASSNWNDPLNWNIFQVPSSTVSAIVANNLPSPVINSTSGNAAANNVTLLAGAVLTISNNVSFDVAGSITNGGTLTVSNGSASAISVGSNWSDNGTFNPGASTVTLAATSGPKSIVSSASSKFNNLTVAGSTTYSLSSAINLNGNLTINNGATLSTGSGNNAINVAGNIVNNGTFVPGTGTVTLTGTSGTQSITSGTTSDKYFYNLTKSSTSTSTLSLNTNIYVANDLVINKGNFIANGYDLNVGGNYTWNNSTGSLTNADIVFVGSATKLFSNSSNSSGNTFNNVTFNKSAGTIILSNSITVNGTLTLSGGKMQLGARNLTLGTSAVVSGGSASSYIQADGIGTVIKNLNAGAIGNTVTLPIGDASNYTPMTFNLTAGTLASGANVAVNLRNTADPNLASTTSYLKRYWEIIPSGITAPVYTVTYTYAESDVVGDETTFRVGKYSTATSPNWTYGTDTPLNWSVNTTSNTLTWTGLTSFSRYTALDHPAPLPVSFIKVGAVLNNDKVLISFSTAVEENNDYFVIESSRDGIHFDSIGTVDGAGTSNQVHHYSFETGLTQQVYYRIKQVDFDRKTSYSVVFEINAVANDTHTHFEIYPNPSAPADELYMAYTTNSFDNEVTVTVIDLSEKVHYTGLHEISYKGVVRLPIINKKNLPSGIYMVIIKSQDQVYTYKLLVI